MRRALNTTLALLAIASLLMSIKLYTSDQEARKPAKQFAKKYAMDLRRPEVIGSLELATSAGEAADLMADTAIRDAVSPVSLANVTPAVRQAWLDLVRRTDDELKDAVPVVLDAIARNPGWPYHEVLLGEAVYTRYNRTLSPDLVKNYEQWRNPLLAGATAANVDDNLWQSLAVAYIQTWPDLDRVHEKTATAVFGRAFEDPDFVKETFAVAMQTIGKERAVRAIPDRAKPLWAAFRQLAKSGDVLTAWSVHQRWDAVEWRERGEDLAAIERQWNLGDLDETRRLCQQWASLHSVWNYDSPAAHDQAARLLELWPDMTEGQWRNDSRADIVRYFLSGRTSGANGAVLVRTLDSIAGVPVPVAAQIHVLAGDVQAAESIARAADGFGSFEWTPYILELTRYWLDKDKVKARAALAQLAPAARGGCQATQIETLLGLRQQTPVETLDVTIPSGGTVPICIGRAASLTATFSSPLAAIVDYGWDGARSGSILISSSSVTAPVAPKTSPGMRTFATWLLASSGETPVVQLRAP